MAELRVKDLIVRRNGRMVLDGCSAGFPAGLRTVLWGPSGAGKSTLLAAIAGLVRPNAGTIELGMDVFFSERLRINVAPNARSVGLVFQDLALWPHLRALDQVRLVGKAVGSSRSDALALLESVGILNLADRRPAELSGGEQQRLAIARALAMRPKLLLFDEPLSSVDGATRRSLRTLIRQVSPQVPGPTIYVTHDETDAQELAENVVGLQGGTLQQVQSISEI